MQRDAETHAEEDKQRRELVEAKNNAESMCFQLEKLLKEHESSLGQTDKDPAFCFRYSSTITTIMEYTRRHSRVHLHFRRENARRKRFGPGYTVNR